MANSCGPFHFSEISQTFCQAVQVSVAFLIHGSFERGWLPGLDPFGHSVQLGGVTGTGQYFPILSLDQQLLEVDGVADLFMGQLTSLEDLECVPGFALDLGLAVQGPRHRPHGLLDLGCGPLFTGALGQRLCCLAGTNGHRQVACFFTW